MALPAFARTYRMAEAFGWSLALGAFLAGLPANLVLTALGFATGVTLTRAS